MQNPVRRLNALTGLRFIAAAAVVFAHSEAHGPELSARFGQPARHLGNVAVGPNAVGFFFILSGFILAYVYPRLSTCSEAARFLLARFARLWPAHLFGMALAMGLAGVVFWPDPQAEYHPLSVLGLHTAMLQSWVPSYKMAGAYNMPSWSIATEFVFYLLFIPLIHQWSRTWWWKLPLTLAIPLGLALLMNARGWTADAAPGTYIFHALYFNPLSRVWLFAFGMATALLWQRVGPRLKFNRTFGTLIELAAGAAVVASNYYANDIGVAAQHTSWLGLPIYHLLYGCSMVVALPFALLIFVMAQEQGWISRFFAMAPLVLLGEISFAVYILHWPLLMYLARHLGDFQSVPGWTLAGGYWSVLLALSYWTHFHIERPGRRWLIGLWPAGGFGQGPRSVLATLRRTASVRTLAETAALVTVLIGIGYYATRANFHYIKQDKLEETRKFALDSTRDVRFGDGFLLRGATMHEAPGGVQLHLVWQSLKPQPPGFKVMVQGVTAAPAEECIGAVVAGDTDFSTKPIPAGVIWEQRVFLKTDTILAANQVVLLVMNRDETNILPVTGGLLDQHGRLKLLPHEAYRDRGVETAQR